MELKNIFNAWAASVRKKYTNRQWMLSKWEVIDGIRWPQEKIDLMINDITRGLDLGPKDILIDLGCGGGWILAALKKHAPKAYGLDISGDMLAHAVEAGGNKNLVCAEIGRLPFKTEVFSRVLSYYVFMNFSDDGYIEKAILEVMRILKKGGCALIGQLPDREGSSRYDRAKEEYLRYCEQEFKLGRDYRTQHAPPIKLFDKERLFAFLRSQKISYKARNSFNPFYRPGQPAVIDWRFDVVLHKA